MIRIPQVRVVDEEGAQLGVMPTPKALAMAQERGYDLVEVAPMASPPVARFLDFGQYKYELTKREKEAKRKQRSVTFKEVRLKPKIGIGDFDTKVRRAIEFLEEGDRIKVAVQFRGRELTHPEIGRALLEKFSDKIKDHGVIERAPLLEGKSMHITVASVHKPKVPRRALDIAGAGRRIGGGDRRSAGGGGTGHSGSRGRGTARRRIGSRRTGATAGHGTGSRRSGRRPRTDSRRPRRTGSHDRHRRPRRPEATHENEASLDAQPGAGPAPTGE